MIKGIKMAGIFAMLLMLLALSACGGNSIDANNASSADERVNGYMDGSTNPWTASDKNGVLEATGFDINPPEGATDVYYSFIEESKLAQMTYVLDELEFTYRIKASSELEDISGMHYEWDSIADGAIYTNEAEYFMYSPSDTEEEATDSDNEVAVLNWFDSASGITYSLSVIGDDLNETNITAYAEAVYEPIQP